MQSILMIRKDCLSLVRDTLNDSNDNSESRDGLDRMDTEQYLDKDEDLIEYVRAFKAKIEARYIRSKTNTAYAFPRLDEHEDSEASIQSLQGIRYYNIESQNDHRILNDTERLAIIIMEAGKLSYRELVYELSREDGIKRMILEIFMKDRPNGLHRVHSEGEREKSTAANGLAFFQRPLQKSQKQLGQTASAKKVSHAGSCKSKKRGKGQDLTNGELQNRGQKKLPLRFLRSSGNRKIDRTDEIQSLTSHSKQTKTKARDESGFRPAHANSPHSKKADYLFPGSLHSNVCLTPGSNRSGSTLHRKVRAKVQRDKEPRTLNDSKDSKHSKGQSMQSGQPSSTKLHLNSAFLHNARNATGKSLEKLSRERVGSPVDIPDALSQRFLRVTLSRCKNTSPLVQINNILGNIKDPSTTSKGLGGSQISGLRGFPTSSTQGKDNNQSSDRQKSRSRKSPSIEIALDSERLRIQSLLRVKQGYPKQFIANYLSKNRLANL